MKKSKEVIDWGTIRREEKRIKHDVMAHNYAFGKVKIVLYPGNSTRIM